MTEGYTQIITSIKEEQYYQDNFTYGVVFGEFKYSQLFKLVIL